MDVVTYIGEQIKSIMLLIASIDLYMPDEDSMEVLIGAVSAWASVESELLYAAVEAAIEGSEIVTQPARERLHTLYALQANLHEGEGAEAPFNQLAAQYIDGVKYHLAVDMQEIAPMTTQLPDNINRELVTSMQAMKLSLE
jgi:hypothetical protein